MPKNEPALVHRKVAVLGFRAVGKTSLTNAFVSGTFADTYDPTDEYSRLSRNASVGVHGYALVFSITSRETFERIEPINEALLNALGDAQDVPRILVGSMKDLSHQRQVSTQDAQALADSMGVPYLECSSKTGENVGSVFHDLMKEIEKDDGLLNESEENGCTIL
eukprot:CAMPEP_0178731400 /NCGR_PEP_ID=MMETSP0699-20121125/30019_1 /TAXON_ID=265572 /ORGANISM="Extubocellulus spinifer, Strain CCMP396" /LENGTH=164 /DNA_ID=CAMNT_0020383463 /DNA_START=96 /DNA_END=590 /DNA_ORIENTATION=-